MYVHLLPMTLPPYNHSWAEHIVSVLSFNSTPYRFSSATRRQIAFSVLSSPLSLAVLPSLFSHSAARSLSLQKASGLSPLPSVCPICDAVWATGLIMIGRRSAGLRARQKREQTNPLRWSTKLQSDASPKSTGGLAFPPTCVSVRHARCLPYTVKFWGGKGAEEGILTTQQMRPLRKPLDQNWNHVFFFPHCPSFFSSTWCLRAKKPRGLLKL